MNDAWGYDDNTDGQSGDNTAPETPKALRDAYKRQGEILEQIQKQLADERAERARDKVSSVFSELGVPGAAELYTGEPDPEKARAWAESMRAAFGSGNAQGQAPADVPTPPALDEQTQQQYQQMTNAGIDGQPITSFEAAGLAMQNAKTLEELIAASQASQHLR